LRYQPLTTRQTFINQLRSYSSRFPEEQAFVGDFLSILQQPGCYQRDHLPGHITGSAWIIDTEKNLVLLTHHAKLHRWLQPGGHADGDENIIRVALKEVEEETGLKHVQAIGEEIFDLDIHTIPERKDFPEHLHYDVRILVKASSDEQITLSDESHDLAWIPLEKIAEVTGNNRSMLRMAKK
jgi:8-oxo-dGTP pyrophosphatase MutT (NUDIX family)